MYMNHLLKYGQMLQNIEGHRITSESRLRLYSYLESFNKTRYNSHKQLTNSGK